VANSSPLSKFVNAHSASWELLALMILALPLIIPFLAPGLPNTADAEIHLHRIISTALDISAGYLWPRWTPYLHLGYGYPIHNFYAPGIHILGGILYLITHLDPVVILKVLQIGATLLYPFGAYRFARTFAGKPGALVAAAAYTYAPFRFNELWVQANLAQFCAMALLPWLFWAIALGAQKQSRGWIAFIGCFFAAIVLLHHPTGFLVAPFAGLYVLWLSFTGKVDRLRTAVILSIGLALGLILSAIFWLPALAEYRYVQIERVQQGIFNVAANTISLLELIRPIAPVDRTLLNPPQFYNAGLAQVAAALLGLVALVRAPPQFRRNLLFGVLALVACLWLITPSSEWIWLNLPIAQLVIYPWRLLGIAALMIVPGAAALPSLVPTRWRNAVAGAAIGVFFAVALPMFYAPLTFYQVPPATPETAIQYEQRTGNLGLTSADEYLPRWAEKRPLGVHADDYEQFEWRVDLEPGDLPASAQAARVTCARGATCYHLDASESFTLIFHQMYFPGWRVTIDGIETTSAPIGENGLLSVAVPVGSHIVSVTYAGTMIQHVSDLISLIALVITVLLIVTAKWKAQPRLEVVDPRTHTLVLRVIIVIGGFMLVNQIYLEPQTSVFRPSSAPSTPPAQHLVQVDFGNWIELVGYDIGPDPAQAGDLMTVRLYWRRGSEQPPPELRAAVHITALDGREDWGGTESLTFAPLPPDHWNTTGYIIDEYRFRLHADASPYLSELRVALFSSAVGTPSTTIKIAPLRVVGNRLVFSEDELTISGAVFGDQIALLGAGLRQADNGEPCIDLRWQAGRDGLPDYTVMLHLLDQAETAIAVADAPPLDRLYPTSSWLSGQILDDSHCFESDASLLELGLYDSNSGIPLPVVATDSSRVADNSLLIPLPIHVQAPDSRRRLR
jgi:6-pyruvoyl-tetrahydropterin synthase related domain